MEEEVNTSEINGSREDEKSSHNWGLLFIFLAVVFLVLIIANRYEHHLYEELLDRAQYGDSYGFANALFTGLAFAGLLYTIYLQGEELKEQRKEIRKQRKEMRESNKLMEEQKKSMQLQQSAMENQARSMEMQRVPGLVPERELSLRIQLVSNTALPNDETEPIPTEALISCFGSVPIQNDSEHMAIPILIRPRLNLPGKAPFGIDLDANAIVFEKGSHKSVDWGIPLKCADLSEILKGITSSDFRMEFSIEFMNVYGEHYLLWFRARLEHAGLSIERLLEPDHEITFAELEYLDRKLHQANLVPTRGEYAIIRQPTSVQQNQITEYLKESGILQGYS